MVLKGTNYKMNQDGLTSVKVLPPQLPQSYDKNTCKPPV